MKIKVSGSINLGTALPQYVEDKIEKEVKKYFESAVEAIVNFTKSGHLIHTNIVVNDGTKKGIVIKSDGESDDIYSSFDIAVVKIIKQLRKHKSILKDYKKRKREGDVDQYMMIEASNHILHSHEDETQDQSNFEIIEEKKVEIEELSVNEAIMQMDLLEIPAYIFINEKTKKINLVRKRNDGKVSWIEIEKY